MLRVIHDKSESTTLPELDLFSIPPTSVGVTSAKYIECPLVNHISASSPLEWRYAAQRNFLNLQRSYVLFKASIRKADGSRLVVNENVKWPVSFVQNIGQTMFKQFQVYLNGVCIENTGDLYAYRGIIETELFESEERKKTVYTASGYFPDSAVDSSASPGHLARQNVVDAGKSAWFAAPINLNIFKQPRLLLNYIDLRLIAHINSPKFVIESLEVPGDATQYTVHLEDCKLMLHEYELHESTMTAIETMLKKQQAITYPMQAVQMRSFYMAPGRLDAPENRILTSHFPKRVIACMVESDAFHGNYKKSPFNFKNFGTKDIHLEVGSRMIPAKMADLDFENDNYLQMFMNLSQNFPNSGITRDTFASHSCFFVFNVSPYIDSESIDLLQSGSTSIRVSFKNPLTSGVYMILHCMFDSMCSIDSQRTVHIDSLL